MTWLCRRGMWGEWWASLSNLTLLIMQVEKGFFVARNNTIVGLFFWQLRSGDVSGQWTSETRLPVPNSGPGAGVRCRWAVPLPVRSLLTPVQVWGKKPASFFPPFWLIWNAASCIYGMGELQISKLGEGTSVVKHSSSMKQLLKTANTFLQGKWKLEKSQVSEKQSV